MELLYSVFHKHKENHEWRTYNEDEQECTICGLRRTLYHKIKPMVLIKYLGDDYDQFISLQKQLDAITHLPLFYCEGYAKGVVSGNNVLLLTKD